MTEKIVVKKDTQQPKHFEHIWEESEQLFDAKTLTIDNILNELQAKASLYRVLGNGSFDSTELSRTKTLLIGKLIMTLTMLTLAENANAFEALQMAIADRKVINLEASISKDKNGFDGVLNDLSAKLGAAPGVGGELVDKMKDVLKNLNLG